MEKRYCIFWLLLGSAHFLSLPVLAQWYSTTLSQGRYRMAGTNVGNKALFAGGTYYSSPVPFDVASRRIDIYDGVTNQWSTAQLSQAAHSISAISVDNLAFFAGGQEGTSAMGSTFYANVDIYNTNTNQWITAQLSGPRASMATAAAAGKVFFAGGYTSQYFLSQIVDIYDIAANQWSATQLPGFLTGIRAASMGSKVLFAAAPQYTLRQFYLYDVSTGQWATKMLPLARADMVITAIGTKAFFAGGTTADGNPSERVDIYDATTDQWSVAQLSQARADISAFSGANKVFLAGGSANSNVIDIYDATTNQWSTAQLSAGRSGIAISKAGNKVFFAGSSSGSAVVDIYDSSTNQWSATQLPQATASLVAVSAGERALFAENGLGVYGQNSLGKVDIYTTNAALPVDLISFSGKWTENIGAQLTWQTALETKNDHFEIQRSGDAKSFESIGRIQGQGTTTAQADYSFVDVHMADLIAYYRLKQVDLDGTAHYSRIIAIHRQGREAASLSLWPSPTSGPLTVELSGGASIQAVGVYDLHGRGALQTSAHSSVDLSELSTGVYILDVLTTDGQRLQARFVKQ